ncbi:hypothetical protein ABLB90_04510 [Photorhabdus bodei]
MTDLRWPPWAETTSPAAAALYASFMRKLFQPASPIARASW